MSSPTSTVQRAQLTSEDAASFFHEEILDRHWNVRVHRCDDLLNVYAVSEHTRLGSSMEHPCVNVVFLIWVKKGGEVCFKTLVKPSDVKNSHLDVLSVRLVKNQIVVTSSINCGPGHLKDEKLVKKIGLRTLNL